jgi:hypothetical protein
VIRGIYTCIVRLMRICSYTRARVVQEGKEGRAGKKTEMKLKEETRRLGGWSLKHREVFTLLRHNFFIFNEPDIYIQAISFRRESRASARSSVK